MHYYNIESMPFGENIYIIYDDVSKESFVVDPGGNVKDIEKFIKNKDLTLKYIILTHGHVDHIAGVLELKKLYPSCDIVCSKKEQKLLKEPNLNLTSKYGLNISIEADRLIEEIDIISIGSKKLSFMITSGHTKGSMCIRFDDTLITGDTLFAGSIGRTDLPTGSYDEMMISLERLKNLDDNITILPGHGPSSTIGEEKRHNPFLR